MRTRCAALWVLVAVVASLFLSVPLLAQPRGVNDGWQDDGTVVRLKTLTDRVGIGTTTPGGKLDITTDGQTRPSIELTNTCTLFGDVVKTYYIDVTNEGCLGNRLVFGYAEGWDTSGIDLCHGEGAIMAFRSEGNVGIGTLDPEARLHVAGDAIVSGPVGGIETTLQVIGGSGAGPTHHGVQFESRGYDPDIAGFIRVANLDRSDFVTISSGRAYDAVGRILFSSALTRLDIGPTPTDNIPPYGGISISASGNVGIGTTAPRTKLEVQAGPTGILLTDENSNNGSLQIAYNDAGAYSFLQSADASILRSLSLNPNGGNVGIGTTAPQAKLDVAGPMQVQSDMYVWGSGQIGGALTVYGGDVTVLGNLWVYGYKYFVQPHPEDAAKEIRFVCLEGPEAGTYFRGSSRLVDGQAVVEVPEAFSMTTEPEGLTVQLTAIGPARIWVEQYDLNRIAVRGDADIEFHYLVNGVRRGFADFKPIGENQAYLPATRGVPYGEELRPSLREMLVENGTLNTDFTPNETTAARLGWTLEDPTEKREKSPSLQTK
ncbi:MAG: hypothetical protein AB1486_18270 [Planctomycetota bacterium]